MLVGGNFPNFGINPTTSVDVQLNVTGPDGFSAGQLARGPGFF